MIEIKSSFSGGLDFDSSYYNITKDCYVDALNITRDAVEGSNDKAITNIVGNQLVNYVFHDTGRRKVIGAFANTLRNTVIYFVWLESGYDEILQYDDTTRAITPIFKNLTDSGSIDILGFTENGKINSVNVYPRDEGDLLFFLDSLGRPTTMDITRFLAGSYTPVTRDIIDVGKNPPLAPPSCVYGNDTIRRTNSLRNKLFRFRYLYIYDNNEESSCSPISIVPLPANILSDTYNNVITNNNRIDILLNSGEKSVKSIQLLMSYVNKTNSWSDFAIVETIDKSKGVILSATSRRQAVILLNDMYAINLSGVVVAGAVITVTLRRISDGVVVTAATYTTVSGDTLSTIAAALVISAAALGISSFESSVQNVFYLFFSNTTYTFEATDIVLPTGYSIDNLDFPYSFYNDSTYPVKNINQVILLYDFTPDLANAQEMPNGDTLMYSGITEGYDNDLEPSVLNEVLTVASGAGVPTGTLNATVIPGTGTTIQATYISFSGIAAIGTVITVQIIRRADSVVITVGTYTTVAGDTPTSVTAALLANMQTNIPPLLTASVALGQLAFSYSGVIYNYHNTTVVAPTVPAADNSIPTFLFSTQRRIAIAYFDKKGKTNGILYDDKISFPAYAENGSQAVLLPYINTKILHQPPIWAYSFNFYLTKEPTQFIFWETVDVNVTEIGYIYFNVSNFEINQIKTPATTQVLSYTYQDGDRVRLIRDDTSNTVFNDTYDAAIEGLLKDPKINGVQSTGNFIKIKSFAPFNTVNYSSKFFIIQIYRPEQQAPNDKNAVFYEYGQQYPVLNPGTVLRAHGGMVTDQDTVTNIPAEFNFYGGDVYFRLRAIAISETGIGVFNALDRNFVDIYISAVNSIDGRPNVIDINAKRAYYSTLTRHSEAYQANTNINGLNRFYPNNFQVYDTAFGDVMRLKVRDRFVRVYQKFKVGQVPLYHQILTDNNNQNLVVTDRLLNPIQYYIGDIGIGDNSESLASYNYADYFTTNVKGIVGRVSNDGIKFLSVDHKVNSWATQEIPLRKGQYKIYGAFDQRLGNYIIALEATNTSPAYTLLWDEENNSFESPVSFHPEMMTTLGVLLISFKDGDLYTHDNPLYNTFYGVTYDSYIKMAFNERPLDKKTFETLTEVASQVWVVPEITTDLNSFGTTKMKSNMVAGDFEPLEGSFEGAILRDENSEGGVINGDTMKGKYAMVKFSITQPTTLVSLNLVSLKYINSPLNTR